MPTAPYPRILPLCVAIGTALGAVAVQTDTDSPNQPNILFAFADDWGCGHAGVFGDTTVQTPTFDRVAREELLFTNAHISSPSCTPSRGAVLAG
jgi:N-sulfoglucosamine sulfohydrolase